MFSEKELILTKEEIDEEIALLDEIINELYEEGGY